MPIRRTAAFEEVCHGDRRRRIVETCLSCLTLKSLEHLMRSLITTIDHMGTALDDGAHILVEAYRARCRTKVELVPLAAHILVCVPEKGAAADALCGALAQHTKPAQHPVFGRWRIRHYPSRPTSAGTTFAAQEVFIRQLRAAARRHSSDGAIWLRSAACALEAAEAMSPGCVPCIRCFRASPDPTPTALGVLVMVFACLVSLWHTAGRKAKCRKVRAVEVEEVARQRRIVAQDREHLEGKWRSERLSRAERSEVTHGMGKLERFYVRLQRAARRAILVPFQLRVANGQQVLRCRMEHPRGLAVGTPWDTAMLSMFVVDLPVRGIHRRVCRIKHGRWRRMWHLHGLPPPPRDAAHAFESGLHAAVSGGNTLLEVRHTCAAPRPASGKDYDVEVAHLAHGVLERSPLLASGEEEANNKKRKWSDMQ